MTPKPFVYLHGFASGPASQKARFFRARFEQCGIPLEIPGLAAGDFENLTVTGQLAVLERLCGGRPATLIGSSLGGYLAALYAARHPEVERLVLMAPAFEFARRWASWLGAEQLANWRRTGSIEIYHYGDKRPRRLGYGLVEDAARYEDYPDIRQPVLIFHGARDDAVPVEYSREFASTRPNVRLEVLDSGHELLDVLDRMWDETRRFCKIMLS
jgi:uncharacterized protein